MEEGIPTQSYFFRSVKKETLLPAGYTYDDLTHTTTCHRCRFISFSPALGRYTFIVFAPDSTLMEAAARSDASRALARHSFGCAGSCCSTSSGASASMPSWAMAGLRSSGPPRTGPSTQVWGTPEKPAASLARSLPLHSEKHVDVRASQHETAGVAKECDAAASDSPSAAEDVVRAACTLLDHVVGDCSVSRANPGELSPEQVFAPIFHSVSVPGISGGDYLVKHLLRLGLARKEHLSEAVALHSFLLIDRLLQKEASRGARPACRPPPCPHPPARCPT
jgi:hypothetical protein